MDAQGNIVYMLRDPYGSSEIGPLLGKPGLDFGSLAAEFRTEIYAKHEAEGKDWCLPTTSEFVDWLIGRGLLTSLNTISITLDIDTSGENAYVPSHWPLCPECGEGRGDEEMGRVLHSLNRREWFRKCTKCSHTWDHHDEPYRGGQPMLDDDGRYIDGGCVPYAISQAGGIPMDHAVAVCRKHGWAEGQGIEGFGGVAAAVACGLVLVEQEVRQIAGTLTLRKLFDRLPSSGSYIVAIRGHWLAFVGGENRDQAGTHLRAEVTSCWEVLSSGL